MNNIDWKKMNEHLYYNTVSSLLLKILQQLMGVEEFCEFRLVGGTALSLQRGHRESVDIDLFTDAAYGSINFDAIDKFLAGSYSYVDTSDRKEVGIGRSYFIGKNKDDCIKLDMYYTDKFIKPILKIDSIRMASIEEIIAMKLDVIARGGRKKDFWDIHELMEEYPLNLMMALHKERYPYSHNKKQIKNNFTNFSLADDDFEPICLRHKYWEVIKLDMIDFVKGEYL
jgi:predicted nucleotidyltransferase component of viral defense system